MGYHKDLNAAVAYFCNLSYGIFKGISLEGIGAKCQLDLLLRLPGESGRLLEES